MAIAKFTDLLARGKTVPLFGTGQTRRDYTYIDDIVDGVLAALDLAPGFEIFNLGGSQTTTLIDLVHWIAEALEVEARRRDAPRAARRRADHLRRRLEGRRECSATRRRSRSAKVFAASPPGIAAGPRQTRAERSGQAPLAGGQRRHRLPSLAPPTIDSDCGTWGPGR